MSGLVLIVAASVATSSASCNLTGEWTFLPPAGTPWSGYGFTYNVVHHSNFVTFTGYTTPVEVRASNGAGC